MDAAKPWKCKNGHVLGQVVRNGSGVRRLYLYRQAVDETDPQDAPDTMAVVEGYVSDVRCSICGCIRTWVPGEEAMRQMVERNRDFAGVRA